MTELEKLLAHAISTGKPLYIEHNDFRMADIDFEQELSDLLDDGDIGRQVAERIDATESIFSIRYYESQLDFHIVYDATAELAAGIMNAKLGVV